MARRETFSPSNTGLVQNCRDSICAKHMDPVHYSLERRLNFQAAHNTRNGVQPDYKSGVRQPPFAPTSRPPHPGAYSNIYSPSLSNNQASFRNPSPPEDLNSLNLDSYPGDEHLSNLTAQPQNNSLHQLPNNQTRRPLVRLPRVASQPSPKSDYANRNSTSLHTDLKTRSAPSPIKDPPQKHPSNAMRRHRHSNSTSSKTSTVSTSSTTNNPAATQPSSPETIHFDPAVPPKPAVDNLDEEWLLLRNETFSRQRPTQRDKYGHLHPLVRKYAGLTIPEVKTGEPRWANAVLSRRWQREETLEREKREARIKREEGIEPPTVATCRTKEQSDAFELAQLTLSMLKEFDEDSNSEDIDESASGMEARDI